MTRHVQFETLVPPIVRLASRRRICPWGDHAILTWGWLRYWVCLFGAPGNGFRIATATLDVFRSTAGAAALGFARRPFEEAIRRASTRKLLGTPLADLQLTQAALAAMALGIEASAMLVCRAERVTREAAMAKLHATASAQATIDKALQIFGGQGVESRGTIERLNREIRALRVYEGASEVQKVVIARQALASLTQA